MKSRQLRDELILVAMAILLAIVMRFSFTERLAVEHFDEGVYSAGLWYPDALGEGYPSRQFFAPPALPTLIEWLAVVVNLGKSDRCRMLGAGNRL